VSRNQSDENEVEDMMTFHLLPLLPFHPNNTHKDDHEDNKEDLPVAQLLIDDNFSYISIF